MLGYYRIARFAPCFLWRLLLRDLLPGLNDAISEDFPRSNGAARSWIGLDRVPEVPTIT